MAPTLTAAVSIAPAEEVAAAALEPDADADLDAPEAEPPELLLPTLLPELCCAAPRVGTICPLTTFVLV